MTILSHRASCGHLRETFTYPQVSIYSINFSFFLSNRISGLKIFFVFLWDLDIPIKKSPLDYKSNSSCSSPSKMLENHQQKNSDRCSLPFGTPVPVLPVRNNLRRPNSTHFPPSRFQFRKGFTSCSWKRTAIIFIILSVVLLAAVTYMLGKSKQFFTLLLLLFRTCTPLSREKTIINKKMPHNNDI